jgi:hypothetical protein
MQMRGLLLLLGIWTAFVVLPSIAAAAPLGVTPAEVDFGKQRQEQTVTTVVKLKNLGTKPLEILRVGADCSCTAAKPERTSLAPGESTDLQIAFETRTYQGEVTRKVLVQTSEGDVFVPVKALVSQYENWVLGANLAVLKPSLKGEAAETTFLIHYTGTSDAQVTNARSSVPWLEAKVLEQKEGKVKIGITKKPEAPAGNHQPKVTLDTTEEKEKQIEFTVFASVQSRLVVNPNPILLPPVKIGQPATIPVSLSGWEPAADPRGELPGGKVALRQRDRTDALIDVSVAPDQPGVGTRLLRIFAGDSLEAEIPVIVRAEQ